MNTKQPKWNGHQKSNPNIITENPNSKSWTLIESSNSPLPLRTLHSFGLRSISGVRPWCWLMKVGALRPSCLGLIEVTELGKKKILFAREHYADETGQGSSPGCCTKMEARFCDTMSKPLYKCYLSTVHIPDFIWLFLSLFILCCFERWGSPLRGRL